MGRMLVWTAVLACVLVAPGVVLAEGAGNPDEALRQEILKRLQSLESAVQTLQGSPSALPPLPKDASSAAILERLGALESTVRGLQAGHGAAAPASAPAEEPDLLDRVSALEKRAENIGFHIYGSLDVSYGYNMNEPDSRANKLRVFDTKHDEFNANLLDLILEKPTEGPGTWGFRADLDAGEDPSVFQAFGWNDGDNFELQQAYVQWVAPVGSGLTLRLGKFVTNHGMEVIESADNWNTSRSFMFGFAIPFTHTGFAASYTFDQVQLMLGIVNGWDNVDDNNDGKTFHGMLKWTPSDKLNLTLSGTYGPERTGNEDNMRGLATLALCYVPLEDLSLGLDVDYGDEEGAGVGRKMGEFAEWWGAAIYAKYNFCPTWSLALRAEHFVDDDGARMGLVGQRVQEMTLTAAWKPIGAAEVRLEYRHDWSSVDVFDDGEDVGTSDEQDTMSFEVIYRF